MQKLGITLPTLYQDTRKRVIVNMSVFVGMFFCSWAPYYIVRLITGRLVTVAHVDIATELAAFHAVANPLAYLYLNKNCWRAFNAYINQYNMTDGDKDQQGQRLTETTPGMEPPAEEVLAEDASSTVTATTSLSSSKRSIAIKQRKAAIVVPSNQ